MSQKSYREAVDAAQLINLRLIKSEFVVEPEGLGRDKTQWKSTYDFKVRNVSYDEPRTLLTALLAGEANCKIGKKKIISLKCLYLVAYSVTGAPDPEAARTFASRVAGFAAYPYFRSHFAEACGQAGIDLPPLPLMKEPPRRIEAASD